MGQVSGTTAPTMAPPSNWSLALTRQAQTKETVMKLAIIAFAALSALIAAAPAHADPRATSLEPVGNGLQINGIAYNALTFNGIQVNGITSNGLTSNGLTSNGLTTNGLTTNGTGMNSLLMNGVAEQGSVGAKPAACTTGAEPVCELGPIVHVQSVTLGNGKKLELR
jgi:hypothetical protein